MKFALRSRIRAVLRPLAILLACTVLAEVGSVRAQDVSFADTNLETAVEQQLGLAGPITQSEMLDLTYLDASGLGVVDTTGLQYASNLIFLKLDNDPITNYSAIAGLTNLNEFDLAYTGVSNLSFMTQLQALLVTSLFN